MSAEAIAREAALETIAAFNKGVFIGMGVILLIIIVLFAACCAVCTVYGAYLYESGAGEKRKRMQEKGENE